jgi:o-succinylbenzoate---CoA ligase
LVDVPLVLLIVRPLHAVDAVDVMASLPAALDGAGPALLPLPPEPAARAAIIEALQPDDPDAPLDRDDISLVVATSGSSGAPKGVMLTASALLRSAQASHKRLGGEGQWLLALPVHHIAGVQVLVRSLVGRIEPVVQDLSSGFSITGFVEATARLEADRCYTSLVPTQLKRLLDAGAADTLRRFDAVLLGGAAVPPGLVARARSNAVNVVVTYGMSETSGGCVYDGEPLEDVSVDVGADGRIVVEGPVVLAGYRLRPDLTATALVEGRLLTQDLGRIDTTGRLEVLGRMDDVLISGGENVSLAAVETVLIDQPRVVDAAAVALPDEEWGQRVVAFVVATTQLNTAALREAVGQRLGQAAVPRDVIIVAELPHAGPGKVDHARLLARARRA